MLSASNSGTVPPRIRLALKPAGVVTGFLDGGWWPRSDALEKELPQLQDAVRRRLGPVESVSYHLGDWKTPPRRISLAGESVRLAGYHTQAEGTVDIVARDARLTLLIIDPAASEHTAQIILDAAADPENTDRPDTLLHHTDDQNKE